MQRFKNKLTSMTPSNSNLVRRDPRLSMRRRFRRVLVRARVSRVTVPSFLLLFYAGVMVGLTQVADQWIVALATTPLVFALLISIGCIAAYRRDFYA